MNYSMGTEFLLKFFGQKALTLKYKRQKMNNLEKIIIEPQNKADSAVIWLHGLGADGHDFEPVVSELKTTNVRFIFPHAPIQPVTLNNGISMRAWFDIFALSLNTKEDEVGIRSSQNKIEAIIEEQIQQGIPAARIFLVGFSQGGAMAMHTGLRYPQPLAGIIVLSAYLPLREKLLTEMNEAQLQTPIFMAHGLYDTVLPYLFGEASRKLLESLGFKIEWHSYAIDHGVCAEEIVDIRQFLQVSIK